MQTNAPKTNSSETKDGSREKRNAEQDSSFEENTGSTLQLKAAQDMADNSPQANQLSQLKQIAGSTQPVAQLKTDIKHTTGTINVDGKGAHRPVGKGMYAKLDPDNPVRGSATGVNSDWMKWIRNHYKKANVVRGHLLNHDLGGFGIEENLYPISTKANADHSAKVEQNVKGHLSDLYSKTTSQNPGYVHYRVNVDELQSYEKAQFLCSWGVEYPIGKWLVAPKHEPIPSDLGNDSGGFGGGKKNKHSPFLWQHGTSKGGKEVTSVKKRIDDAIKNGNLSFNQQAGSPGKTSENDQQDTLEWLNDFVDEYGFQSAWDTLLNGYQTTSGGTQQFYLEMLKLLQQ